MSEVLDRYRALADDFSARVNTVPAAAWSNQSPCEEWTARDVVTHVIGIHRHFLSILDGTPEPSGDPGDVVAAWTAVRSDVETALADPDRAGRVVETPFGTMPFEVLVGRFMSVDLLVHTWDLSRARGCLRTRSRRRREPTCRPSSFAFSAGTQRPFTRADRRTGAVQHIAPPGTTRCRTRLLTWTTVPR
jgi:uncharacterized protein (TIGR03086 family)